MGFYTQKFFYKKGVLHTSGFTRNRILLAWSFTRKGYYTQFGITRNGVLYTMGFYTKGVLTSEWTLHAMGFTRNGVLHAMVFYTQGMGFYITSNGFLQGKGF